MYVCGRCNIALEDSSPEIRWSSKYRHAVCPKVWWHRMYHVPDTTKAGTAQSSDARTIRKAIYVVFGIIAAILLAGTLVVGGIFLFTFRAVGNSQAANTARNYLRNNETLKKDIGEVKDFGWFIVFDFNNREQDGDATLWIKVIGEKKTVGPEVKLAYHENGPWQVTGASYDRDGTTVDLMQGSAPAASRPPP